MGFKEKHRLLMNVNQNRSQKLHTLKLFPLLCLCFASYHTFVSVLWFLICPLESHINLSFILQDCSPYNK